jgi:uncharacterized protein YbjT (DUF2867 family)
VLLHDPEKADDWQRQGAKTAVADVHDTETLRRVFQQGSRLFLLNPPAPPATDTATEERRSVAAILAALPGSGLERIVALSVAGAQSGDRLGDLSVLYELEQALVAQPIPVSIIRAAYYMSNWDAALATARQEGKVHTFYPVDFKLPMVAPADLGEAAARLLMAPEASPGPHYVEGPTHYSSAEVATAFAEALHQPVVAIETPRPQWHQALRAMGFSDKAAESFSNMTALTLQGQFTPPEMVERGPTTLQAYVQELVRQNPPSAARA